MKIHLPILSVNNVHPLRLQFFFFSRKCCVSGRVVLWKCDVAGHRLALW